MELIDKLIQNAPKDDHENNVRINLTPFHYLKLLEILKQNKDDDIKYLIEEIGENSTLVKKYNIKKSQAAMDATQVRTDKAIKHIKDAVDYIKRNDIKMTQSAVVKYSKCSVNTVRKYSYLFKE